MTNTKAAQVVRKAKAAGYDAIGCTDGASRWVTIMGNGIVAEIRDEYDAESFFGKGKVA